MADIGEGFHRHGLFQDAMIRNIQVAQDNLGHYHRAVAHGPDPFPQPPPPYGGFGAPFNGVWNWDPMPGPMEAPRAERDPQVDL